MGKSQVDAEEKNKSKQSAVQDSQKGTESSIDVGDIEDWTSCKRLVNNREHTIETVEDTHSTGQRALRSATSKENQGKSVFGGETLLFNIQRDRTHSNRVTRGRRWSTPTKVAAGKEQCGEP